MPAAPGHDSAASAPDAAAFDSRRWLRDMGALLALPAMWMDLPPAEIARSLVSVLAGILQLRAVYVRSDGAETGDMVEAWSPVAETLAPEFVVARERVRDDVPGISSLSVEYGVERVRVASVPLALPWETALVLASSERPDFPTALETHLMRVAVGQAAIAFHTARRLAREQAARESAEAEARRKDALVRALVDDLEPSLTSISRRIRDVVRAAAEADPPDDRRPAASPTIFSAAPSPSSARSSVDEARLSRREAEVLGLLAQGLSNKEIAGVLWLSDRTVERHITSLYRKIGVARRSEATAFALSRSPDGPPTPPRSS